MPVRFDDKPRRLRPPKEELVEILVTKTTRAARDGVHIEQFEEGKIYNLPSLCANHALQHSWGVPVEPEVVEVPEQEKEVAIDVSTQDRTVPEVRTLVTEFADLDILKALREGEIRHPRHKGGRTGVLEVLDAKIAELEEPSEEE